jgi:WbqC-like protein family.
MKIAIMQPYIFPYIGYFQLIDSVNQFIIYDDVQFIKGGWINRNSIIVNGEKYMFNLILSGASSNKNINQINVYKNQNKLLKTIEYNYKKAPFFYSIFPLLSSILNNKEDNLSLFIGHSIIELCQFINIDTNIIYSSNIEKNNLLKGKDKVIDICKTMTADVYINSIGGKQLYSKEEFEKHNIDLKFLRTDKLQYHQQSNQFIPNLSIIDLLMYNGKDGTIELIKKYTLI